MNRTVKVADSWQKYTYQLTEAAGSNFDPQFKPDLTPQQMLELGVFGGVYFWDRPKELPAEWFNNAKLSSDGQPDKQLNFFQVSASQPLAVWQKKGWINPEDPRGWFQWYCRYYLGRRIPEEDKRQIKRWKAIRRHVSQVQKNCTPGDYSCRPRQRQALLHWAYDSRRL
ncbi:MAG: hypothetical protein R3313_00230 [Candidatus Saccharimonadales bacterium]|nr:hypothetical protein [Candidatus Saccharimonadales bacterium]